MAGLMASIDQEVAEQDDFDIMDNFEELNVQEFDFDQIIKDSKKMTDDI